MDEKQIEDILNIGKGYQGIDIDKKYNRFDRIMVHTIMSYVNDIKPALEKVKILEETVKNDGSVIAEFIEKNMSMMDEIKNLKSENYKLKKEIEKKEFDAAFQRNRAERFVEENQKLRKALKEEIDKYRKY